MSTSSKSKSTPRHSETPPNTAAPLTVEDFKNLTEHLYARIKNLSFGRLLSGFEIGYEYASATTFLKMLTGDSSEQLFLVQCKWSFV